MSRSRPARTASSLSAPAPASTSARPRRAATPPAAPSTTAADANSARKTARGPARKPAPELTLSLQFADKRHRELLPRRKVMRWIQAALESDAELTVRIVDAEEGQTLNRDYRQRDYATNVLTFDYVQEPIVMADLILCAPVVEQEAQEQGKTLEAHYAHMVVHGVLHAQGWDHLEADEAEAMEAREREVMAALGYGDPYGDREA